MQVCKEVQVILLCVIELLIQDLSSQRRKHLQASASCLRLRVCLDSRSENELVDVVDVRLLMFGPQEKTISS